MFALRAATFLFNLIRSSITDSSDSLKRENPHKSHFFNNAFGRKCSTAQRKSFKSLKLGATSEMYLYAATFVFYLQIRIGL